MTNKLEISRELLTILADLNCPYDQLMAAKQRAAEILAAPVVERQEPVAWANWKVGTKSYVPFRSREEASRSVENSEISATQLGPYRVVPLYAEQPSPVAVVLPRDPEKAFFEWTDTLPSAPRCLQTWLAAIDKLKELNQ